MSALSADLLHEMFEYVDGELVRKVTVSARGQAGRAVGSLRADGYMQTQIKGKKYKTHRLIFLMHHGYLPKQVDHIDNDKLNNRIENLRGASTAENGWNQGISSANTSGYKGVTFHGTAGKWRVRVGQHGARHCGGLYDTPEEANEAGMALREKLHGEFMRHE